MSRTPIAVFAGLVFLVAYLFAILALADQVLVWHWAVQAVFFVAAGTLWALPVWWLMLWAVRRRPTQH